MRIYCLLLAALLAFPGVGAAMAAAGTVENITVQVSGASAVPPERVAKRMSASINTIGENVLLGHKVAEIEIRRLSYENLVWEVLERILIGYSVNRVNIIPGETTAIQVEVAPWGEVVGSVRLEIDYGSLSPELRGLVQEDLGNIEDRLNDVFIGLPVDAVDWAGSVSKSMIRELLAAQLPEFRASMEVMPGRQTVVRLSLIPQGALIQDVRVALKSQTIPNILLLQVRPQLSEAANMLNGLPVEFVERRKAYFTARFQDMVAAQPMVKRYGLTTLPLLNAAASTEIEIAVETTKYNISLEGYLDFGREHDSSSAKLHVGKYITSKDEAFFEVEFVPRTVSWNFAPGWGHKLSPATVAGLKYETDGSQGALWLHQKVGPGWQLRLERTLSDNHNELGIRYKIHEFLSAEYVFTDQENWLRLVGNL